MRFINYYNFEFYDYFIDYYYDLVISFFIFTNDLLYITWYNINAFNSLDIFFLLFNVEEIKLEHDKNFVLEKN
jgi:hypothetical protein